MRKLDLETIKQAIRNSSPKTEILIGCDSAKYVDHSKGKDGKAGNTRMAKFARAVIIHVDGNHGCMVFGDIVRERDYSGKGVEGLKRRLMREVEIATDMAMELVESLTEYVTEDGTIDILEPGRRMQVHLDINRDPAEASNIAMKEAIGYVRGMLSMDPVLKPDALAASCCADRLTR